MTAYLFLILVMTTACQGFLYDDEKGEFCASVGDEDRCCAGRKDLCAHQIVGTLCYCDEFCNRTVNPDCCPDYAYVCLGIVPTPLPKQECYYNNRYYYDGETFVSNCNECLCKSSGNHMEIMCEQNKCLVDMEVVNSVNKDFRRYGWRAQNYSMFWGRKLSEGLTFRLGTLHSRRKVLAMTPLKQIIDRDRLPRSFDSRVQWRGLLSAPHDQGWCGSSWVYSTVGVASDRWSIMTRGKVREALSAQHLLSCNSKNQKGCNGGHLSRAWAFIKKFGLVTESCYPWTGDSTRCRLPKHKAAREARCLRDPQGILKEPLYRMGPSYRVISEEGIMQEIKTSGPVQATMRVHPDFFVYSTGIYKCSPHPGTVNIGFHSVRIVGWGEEVQGGRTVKYWIAANSWGENWGENGFFRIRRGTNECHIEDFVIAAWTNIESRRPTIAEVFLSQPNNQQPNEI